MSVTRLEARRAFLRGQRVTEPPLRPPGALAELEFVDRCTRCSACLEACPEQIIRIGDGGFPVLDLSHGERSFCADCARACQSGALQLERVAAWPWRAQIEAGCLAATGVVCRSCSDACPTRAIRFAPTRAAALPQLDVQTCSGCGACVGVCPVNAIQLRLLPAAAAGASVPADSP